MIVKNGVNLVWEISFSFFLLLIDLCIHIHLLILICIFFKILICILILMIHNKLFILLCLIIRITILSLINLIFINFPKNIRGLWIFLISTNINLMSVMEWNCNIFINQLIFRLFFIIRLQILSTLLFLFLFLVCF